MAFASVVLTPPLCISVATRAEGTPVSVFLSVVGILQ